MIRITAVVNSLLTAHWVQVQCDSPWSPRQGHAATALNGSIFVFGGFDESGYCNTAYRLRIASVPKYSK